MWDDVIECFKIIHPAPSNVLYNSRRNRMNFTLPCILNRMAKLSIDFLFLFVLKKSRKFINSKRKNNFVEKVKVHSNIVDYGFADSNISHYLIDIN